MQVMVLVMVIDMVRSLSWLSVMAIVMVIVIVMAKVMVIVTVMLSYNINMLQH